MATDSGLTAGTQVLLYVRSGHTLISIGMSAINEPVDEAVLIGAANRVLSAVA